MSVGKVVAWFQRRLDDLESDNRRLCCAVVAAEQRAKVAEEAKRLFPVVEAELNNHLKGVKACACGDRLALGVVHRQPDDGPCYHPEATP